MNMVHSGLKASVPTEQNDAMPHTLAYQNGAVCFRAGRPMKESNPYRKGTQSHDHFVRGYVDEEVKR